MSHHFITFEVKLEWLGGTPWRLTNLRAADCNDEGETGAVKAEAVLCLLGCVLRALQIPPVRYYLNLS